MTQAGGLTFDRYEDITKKGGWSFRCAFFRGKQVGKIQHRSHGFRVHESGWHVTPENAPTIHAVVVQHGMDADRRVLKPESGLKWKQAKACILSAWNRKYMDSTVKRPHPRQW